MFSLSDNNQAFYWYYHVKRLFLDVLNFIMNRLLLSFITPRYGQTIPTIRIQTIQSISSYLSQPYSSITRLPLNVNNLNE